MQAPILRSAAPGLVPQVSKSSITLFISSSPLPVDRRLHCVGGEVGSAHEPQVHCHPSPVSVVIIQTLGLLDRDLASHIHGHSLLVSDPTIVSFSRALVTPTYQQRRSSSGLCA